MNFSFHTTPLSLVQAQLDRPMSARQVRFTSKDNPDQSDAEKESQQKPSATIADFFSDINQFGSRVLNNALDKAGNLLAQIPHPFKPVHEAPAPQPSADSGESPQEAPLNQAPSPEKTGSPAPDSTDNKSSEGWLSGLTRKTTEVASSVGQAVGEAVTNPVTTVCKVGEAVQETVINPSVDRAQAGWTNAKDQLAEDINKLPEAIPEIILAAPSKPLLPLVVARHFKDTLQKAAQGIWDPRSVTPSEQENSGQSPGEENPSDPTSEKNK